MRISLREFKEALPRVLTLAVFVGAAAFNAGQSTEMNQQLAAKYAADKPTPVDRARIMEAYRAR